VCPRERPGGAGAGGGGAGGVWARSRNSRGVTGATFPSLLKPNLGGTAVPCPLVPFQLVEPKYRSVTRHIYGPKRVGTLGANSWNGTSSEASPSASSARAPRPTQSAASSCVARATVRRYHPLVLQDPERLVAARC